VAEHVRVSLESELCLNASAFNQRAKPLRRPAVRLRPTLVHEIKRDGYRLRVSRNSTRVRCFTRDGHDWADGFPAIVEARCPRPGTVVPDRRPRTRFKELAASQVRPQGSAVRVKPAAADRMYGHGC
jgi:hypothetical protein